LQLEIGIEWSDEAETEYDAPALQLPLALFAHGRAAEEDPCGAR
jgi:hypothetical protein